MAYHCNCLLPTVFQKDNPSVIEITTFIIRLIFEFDTRHLFKKQKGGSYNEDYDEDYNDDEDYENINSNNSPTNDQDKSDVQIILDEIMAGINAGKTYLVAMIMVFVSFFMRASIYPTVPFFGVLAFMYASLKWFFMKFRNL